MSSRNSEMAKALSTRNSGSRHSFFRYLGKKLHWIRTRETVAQLLLIGFLVAVAVILAFPAPIKYQVGDVAESTIRANRAFQLADQATTEMQQREAANKVAPVYILDDNMADMLEEQATVIFRRGRELVSQLNNPGTHEELAARHKALEGLAADFSTTFNIPPEFRIWETLIKNQFSLALERQAVSLAMEVMTQGLLDRTNPFLTQRQRPVSIIVMSTNIEYTVSSGAGLFDEDAADRFLEMRSKTIRARFSPDDSALILVLAKGLMQPNLKPDMKETERRVAEARAHIQPSYFNIRSGEVIVREGSIISPEAMEKIKVMKTSAGGAEWLLRFSGFFLVLFVFFNSSLLLSQISPKRGYQPIAIREQFFIVFLLLLVALMSHASMMIGASLAWDFDFLDRRTVFYAMPIPTAAMLVTIFFGVRKAAFMALLAAVAAAAVTPTNARFLAMIYCYNGAIAAIWCLRNMNERGNLIPASFWVMVANCLTLLGLTMLSDAQWSRQTANNFAAAAASGILSGIAASGMIPLMELVFGFSTNLKLLELGNLDRPILRNLMLSAPGTYHHSVIVGAMVEAAAEAIGANPHLAKVGAYYHDIGKIKKPLYFVENQSGENRHDTLAPSMSALILIGHVREGVELAKENNLPPAICDIIEQHHGTSLMAYFYHKAKEMRQEGQPEINEGDYRYPGPRPRSREAGLVMMADICEAATRSLSEPTPTKIKNMVRQLVNQIFNDSQLDYCELRTKEISEVINTFTNILIGIYHHRVAYPGSRKLDEPPETRREIQPSGKSETAKEIYGHTPVEQPKSATH